MITISLCLIVKNEQHTLPNCLSSVCDIADEIIIVDTGSTDRTKEIARQWTPHVYDFEWIDDFAAARNASFQYATSEYNLWLDADDILEPEQLEKLKKLKEALPEDVDAVSMKYEIPQDRSRNNVSHTMRLRLVKRIRGFRWKGIVHEDLTVDGPYRYMNADITVTHTKVPAAPGGPPSRRNIDIYERQLARGSELSVSDMFHYARECTVHKEYDKAIRYYELCKDRPEISLENRMFILHKLATCYVGMNKPEKELELSLQSLALDVPYPAFSCRMGEHFLRTGHIEAAIFWYRTAYQQPLSERYLWSVADNAYHTWLPHAQLALCYEALGHEEQALFHKQQAEAYRNQTLSPSPPPRSSDGYSSEDEITVYRGQHANTYAFRQAGRSLIRKKFRDTPEGERYFSNEKLAQEAFRMFPWMPERAIGDDRSLVMEMFPFGHRLDAIAHVLTETGRQQALGQIMSMLLDLYVKGFAHRDIHSRNLFFYRNRIVLLDFEYIERYPTEALPSFLDSYDLTGTGLESPCNTQNMCFLSSHPLAINKVLRASLNEAIEALRRQLTDEITAVSATFRKKQGRHCHPFSRPYTSFSLPSLRIDASIAQRDSRRRLEQFGLNEEELKHKSLLDLGCHYGGMIFESQKMRPSSSLGIEFDEDKVHIARKIAAFSNLKNVRFIQGDVDELSAAELGGPFDVVYCLAIEAHVGKPERLYALLGQATKGLLLFEGNVTTDVQHVKARLKEAGFADVAFLGYCDDDFMPSNNGRPLFKACK